MTGPYVQLEARIGEWARLQEDIRAILVIGSRAWAEDQVDEWSDLDQWLTRLNPEGGHDG